ncbi:MAG: NAD(P)-binding domain-containing protein [Hyalangium sp.]|uniref:NAD(P)-binding domain-containing protein n=1 Tax=Hyalangium sp. TaxID=2028555 RepID=UPI00389A69AC
MQWDVVVVGTGPSGLATAINARQRGLRALLLERGQFAATVSRFPHDMVLYSPRDEVQLAAIPCDSRQERPTREEYLSYLARVAELTGLDIREQTEFVGLSGHDGDFTVRARHRGEPVSFSTRKLVLATGAFCTPLRLEVPGADLPQVRYGYGDPSAYRWQRVVVLGGGNGAAEAALRLHNEGRAHVTVVYPRGEFHSRKWRWHLPDLARLIQGEAIRVLFNTTVERVEPEHLLVSSRGETQRIPCDWVIVQIGFEPGKDVLRVAGIQYDEAGCPLFDPLTMQTNVPGVYVAGSLVMGAFENPLFISSIRHHGKAIISHVLGEPSPLASSRKADDAGKLLAGYEGLKDKLDLDYLLDLVPVVIGDLPYQWLDVFHPLLSTFGTEGDGPPKAWADRCILDMLPERHFRGGVDFKGHGVSPGTVRALRMADGKLRLGEILSAIEEEAPEAAQKGLIQSVLEDLLALLYQGKLSWRPTPLGRHDRLA